jgi:hypothetical protein
LAGSIAYSKLSLTGTIVNADVATGAAIAYSKLNLAGSIANADIATGAAIAYSKLNLTGNILNADINASAAIAYTKLALSNSITNADINASAAIVDTKLATISTAGKVSGGAITSGTIGGSTAINTTGTITTRRHYGWHGQHPPHPAKRPDRFLHPCCLGRWQTHQHHDGWRHRACLGIQHRRQRDHLQQQHQQSNNHPRQWSDAAIWWFNCHRQPYTCWIRRRHSAMRCG